MQNHLSFPEARVPYQHAIEETEGAHHQIMRGPRPDAAHHKRSAFNFRLREFQGNQVAALGVGDDFRHGWGEMEESIVPILCRPSNDVSMLHA